MIGMGYYSQFLSSSGLWKAEIYKDMRYNA